MSNGKTIQGAYHGASGFSVTANTRVIATETTQPIRRVIHDEGATLAWPAKPRTVRSVA